MYLKSHICVDLCPEHLNVKRKSILFNTLHSFSSSLQYMPAAAAAPMQGTYIPQYTAVPASAITVEVNTKIQNLCSFYNKKSKEESRN